MANNISSLFYPGSIAVVGVSEDAHKLSSIYFNNLIDAGFKGRLYPVNPKYQELYGFKCYAKVSDIPEAVDQVAILIPAPFVLNTITDCAAKGVKVALIISAGFGEMGAEGKELERKITEAAAQSGMRVLGPNIIGVINTMADVNSSWMQLFPEKGKVSFLSQSGAFCTAVLDVAIEDRVGFNNFCSVGNKADINELDLIDYWYNDDNTQVIGAYLEEIKNGYDLLKYLNTNERIKPVILFKPGKTNAAVKAITSHTGSMAGSVETVETAVKQSGIVAVESTAEMIGDFMTFARSQAPAGKRVAVITNAGGPGIMATDAIVQNGLEIATLAPETQEALKKVLPDAASVHNPIDILGDALADRYLAATTIVVNDPNVDLIMYILTPQYITQIEETAKMVVRLRKSTNKPIFTVFLGKKYVSIGIERMNDSQVPVYNDINNCVESIADLVNFGEYTRTRNLETERSKYAFIADNCGKGMYTNEINALLQPDTQVSVPDDLIAKMAAEVGFDNPKQALVNNLEEAIGFAAPLYPVVIKAPNELLAHKTDFKAVYVNLNTPEELSSAYNQLVATVSEAAKISNPQILIQEMIKAKEEIFIGANRDGGSDVYNGGKKGFGHLIVTGKGGIYTEVYKDIAHVLVPAVQADMEKAFCRTHVSKIVKGVRGQAPLALDKVIEAIAAVQKLVVLYPQIVSMDINPVLLTETRAVAVDIKLFVQA